MSRHSFRHLAVLFAALLTSLSLFPAQADDTEIFVGSNNQLATIKPNILFIFDNSGSMSELITTQTTFDPATNYLTTASCGASLSSRVFFATNSSVPSCSSSSWVNASAVACNAANTAFTTSGFHIGRAARYDASRSAGRRRWSNLDSTVPAHTVDCQADSGIHGLTAASAAKYAKDDTSNADTGYTATAASSIDWTRQSTYTLYSANYVAWYNTTARVSNSKINIVRDVATSLLNSITGVNVGLMYFSYNNQGGLVAVPVNDIETNRATMISSLVGLNAETFTPLSETMYEAGLYWQGKTWNFGKNATKLSGGISVANPSVIGSRLASATSTYKTPIDYGCQKNYIVYLTDGDPTQDSGANSLAATMVGKASCDTTGSVSSPDGICLDDLAGYYATVDQNPNIPGKQTVQTYTIGFASNQTLLQRTATLGGGKYYVANDTAELSTVFQSIVTEILSINTTFSSPTVSVNAFNRTQNLNDIYVTVFRPALTQLWPGNLKKYQIDPATGELVDVNSLPAVDAASGFFKDSAQSYWSAAVDGAQAAQGGAASKLPDPAVRKMYTYYSGSPTTSLTNAANAWSTSNAVLTAAALGIGSGTTLTQAINWLRGADVFDLDADGNITEARLQMGDPLHARPATVIYGGTAASPNANDGVVYAATNEGILQAIDVTSGVELWSYVPDTTWNQVLSALDSTSTNIKLSTLDGNISVLRVDKNFNGVIEPADGDKVYLYFGQRRGGSNYFALDVTDKAAPRFLWKLTSAQLPGIGQTWSTPQVTKADISGSSQSTDNDVLIFGGGYEVDQDPAVDGTTSYTTDATGNGIYIVDAFTGSLLWRAGGTGSGATLELAKMNNAIPADIRVIDFDGDEYADRIYAGDMGGRLWRFDFTKGNSASSFAAGGVFASLGNADDATHPVSTTRRFFYAPDVALVRKPGSAAYLSINAGSGYRTSPLNTQVQDVFYALRDYSVFAKKTQAEFNAWTPITDTTASIVNVTANVAPTIPAAAAGWKINLPRTGEKVLAEARTFGNVVFFPSFTPDVSGLAASCTPRQGTNRLFSVNLIDGSPLLATNRDVVLDPPTVDDREKVLAQGGISPEAVFLFPSPPAGCVGEACRPPPRCLVGLETCGVEFSNAPKKTYWRERQVTP